MAFVNPAAWLLGALFAVLIALYLWERARRRVDVPSLLLWQVLPDAVVRTARFRPDWLFFLQSLLLMLLIAGLADPYLRSRRGPGGPTRSVLVLDLSASMQAREARDTRLDLARTALRQRIEALGTDDEVMLIGAAHQPRVAASFTHDHAGVVRRLAALQAVDTRANLDAALTIATRAADLPDSPATVELFTDTPLDQLAPQWRDRVGIVQIGETDDNLAIEGLQVAQGRFQDYRDAHAYVAVRNFARRETHGVLTLQLDDTVFSRRGFSIAPRSVSGFPLEDLPAPGVLRASLEVDDALTVDNRAYAYVRPVRPLRVLAVSDSPALQAELERIAAATPNLQFTFAPPADYNGADGHDVVLFHTIAPPFPPDAASLYIAPIGAKNPFKSRGTFTSVPILDWNAQHPALAGLRPELPFALTAAQDLDVPVWADALLTSRADGREVALAVAGEHDGQRRAALAFDIATDQLLSADHLNLLLLFLNLLDWLAPSRDAVRIIHTGDVEVVDHLPALPRRIVDPRRHERMLQAEESVTLDAEYAGEYRVAADGTTMRVFANFLDAEESDIGRASQSTSSPPAPRAGAGGAPSRTPRGLGTWLYPIAAALMILEWVAARRRM
jgi:von Willebrand factor type A domain/Aerotolerance regulator N-terminal